MPLSFPIPHPRLPHTGPSSPESWVVQDLCLSSGPGHPEPREIPAGVKGHVRGNTGLSTALPRRPAESEKQEGPGEGGSGYWRAGEGGLLGERTRAAGDTRRENNRD